FNIEHTPTHYGVTLSVKLPFTVIQFFAIVFFNPLQPRSTIRTILLEWLCWHSVFFLFRFLQRTGVKLWLHFSTNLLHHTSNTIFQNKSFFNIKLKPCILLARHEEEALLSTFKC